MELIGRIVNPFNLAERPTFLPGDKVRDKRDFSNKIWRIISRIAYLDTEIMTLREVEGMQEIEMTILAKDLIPYLEMVVMSN